MSKVISKPSKKSGSKSTKPECHGEPVETVESLRAHLNKARAKLGSISSWKHDQVDKQAAVVRELEQEVELLEVRQAPAAAGIANGYREDGVALEDIVITGNHREVVDPAAVERLAKSLAAHKLQQRIGLRDMGNGKFELIFGSRRVAAARLNGWKSIPAKVYLKDLTPSEVEILRTIENFGRKNLTTVEEAVAVARVRDTVQADSKAHTGRHTDKQQQAFAALVESSGGVDAYVAQQLSQTVKWVKDRSYVSQLGGKARQLLQVGRIDVGHARVLAKLGDRDVADRLAENAARNEQMQGGISVQRLETMVQDHLKSLRAVPWRLDVAFGRDKKGCTGHACATCPFNSKSDPDLFGGAIADQPDAGICTHEGCFKAKTEIVEAEMTRFAKKVTPAVKKAASVTLTVLGTLPDMLKPASVERRMKKDLAHLLPAEKTGDSKTATDPRASSRSGDGHSQTAQDKAREQHNQARREWHQKLEDQLEKQMSENQASNLGVRAMLIHLLNQSTWGAGAWQEVGHDDVIGAEYLKEGEKILKLVERGDAGSLLELVALLGRDKDFLAGVVLDHDTVAALAPRIIQSWGGTVPPKPTLDDYMPKDTKTAGKA